MLKRIMFACCLVLLSLAGLHLHRFWLAHAEASAPVFHQETSFDLMISQPYDRVAPLFGADGERAWGGNDWNPHFLFPNPPRDVPGAVFTVHGPSHKSVWITPVFDLEHRHIQHVIFIPDAMVTSLDITFPESTANSTNVHVIYQRTALSPEVNEHVRKMSEHDSRGQDWKKAIDDYFASRKGE